MIGNPPYGAKYPNEQKGYFKKHYITAKSISRVQKGSLDTFTLFIEQGYNLLCQNGSFAYIVPIAITSSDAMTGVHRLIFDNCNPIYVSSYAVRPKPVFENAVVNTSILLMKKTNNPCQHLYSTKMYRRGEGKFCLHNLINHLSYTDASDFVLWGRIPKIGLNIERNILRKLQKFHKLSDFIVETGGKPIYYRTSGGRYFKVVTNYPTGSTKEKPLFFDEKLADSIGCILSSNLSFWFYQIYSNNLDWKSYELLSFVIPNLDSCQIKVLKDLYNKYLRDIEAHANIRQTSQDSKYNMDSFKEYKIVRSKGIIDQIDDYIGPLYGLTADEIDFIKNYELNFRMSGD